MKIRVAYFGLFTAVALIFSYVESLFPVFLGIPGIKLGLANLLILIVLYQWGTKEAFLLSVLRVLIAGFMFGNLFSIFYSLSGALLSLVIMCFLKKSNKFSIIGISLIGGVFHNIGQLIVAGLVLESLSVIYYLPVLLVSGMVTGIIIGILVKEMIKRLHKI